MSSQQRPSVSKKLILCLDGTWQNIHSGLFAGTLLASFYRGEQPLPTNVARIASAIQPADSNGRPQIIAYQAGIGSAGLLTDRLLGGAIGKGLAENIREAYAFLAANHVPGDEIYLIGFSRGAYTARSIGGLVSDMGLLTRRGMDNFVDIFSDWEATGTEGYSPLLASHVPDFHLSVPAQEAKAYLQAYRAELVRLGFAHPHPVPLQAVAVWDTVGALGIPVNPILQRLGLPNHLRFYRFYDVTLSPNVLNAFQALALDERRAAYRPALWDREPGTTPSVKQVWFPGGHSDVGGGHDDMGIANISLAWMMQQLSPFIDFFPDYLPTQLAAQQAYLRKLHVPKGGLRWAASQVTDSARSFAYAILGRHWRSPGRYHTINRLSDRIDLESPLRDTNEAMHVSVRSRIKTGGLDARNKLAAYKPGALKEYELRGEDTEVGQAYYKYTGSDEMFAGKVLREEPLGLLEREIFEDSLTAKRADQS